MKTFKYLSMAAIAATTLTFASCSDDDDNKSNSDKPSIDDIIEDGFYISGDALPFTGVDVKGRMSLTPNEEGGESRDGLIDIYMTLEANKDFYFTEVKGASKKNFGGQGDVKVNQVDIADHYNGVILTGNYVEGESLNVEKSGLYHIAIDQQTQRFVVVPVTHWSIIGGSTDAGWNDNDGLNILHQSSYSATKVVYTQANITLKEGEFKFRHSTAWKQTLLDDGTVKINTNFSGTAGELANNTISFTNHIAGGANAVLTKEHRGVYTVSVAWELGNESFDVSIVKTGDAVIADYPEALWLRGDAISETGWEADQSIPFVKVPDEAHLFWCVAYLNEGKGFKMDPTNSWGGGDFGVEGEAATADFGIEYAKGTANINVPAESGYYIISVDLKENKIAVVKDINIYLIGGDQTGSHETGWTEENVSTDEYKFILSGEEFESPALKAGALRMFAKVPYIASWWQREFHSAEGKILHRETSFEPDPAQVTDGQRVYLNFKAGTAEIR